MTAPEPFPPLAELIPHRPPMVLIDRVTSFDGSSLACVAEIRPGDIFVRGGKVEAIVALEMMAQATAAFLGLSHRDRPTPPQGYLVGSRQLELAIDAFEVGDRLEVRVRHVWGQEPMIRFEGEVLREGVRVVWGTLSVASRESARESGPGPA